MNICNDIDVRSIDSFTILLLLADVISIVAQFLGYFHLISFDREHSPNGHPQSFSPFDFIAWKSEFRFWNC